MGFYEKDGLRYYQFESFKSLPVFHAILTRRGGISQPPFDSLNTGGTVGDDPQAVSSNLKKIFTAFGRDLSSRFDVWQVHGDQVVCADLTKKPGCSLPKGGWHPDREHQYHSIYALC